MPQEQDEEAIARDNPPATAVLLWTQCGDHPKGSSRPQWAKILAAFPHCRLPVDYLFRAYPGRISTQVHHVAQG